MKITSIGSLPASAFAFGLIAVVAGCTSGVTRSGTSSQPQAATVLSLTSPTRELPTPLRTVTPFYPTAEKRSGLTDTVTVRCTVDETGRVRNATVLRYNHLGFVDPAVEALLQWTFRPGTRNGVPVAMEVEIPFYFHLAEGV